MTGQVTFGKTSWSNPLPTSGGGGDDFLNLNKDGQYVLRVIGEAPFEYAAHWADDVNGQIRRLKCAGRDCVMCKEGVKAQVRYLLEVIDIDNSEAKIVEFGTQVYKQIHALYNNKHWGDPRGYNLMIDRNKARGPSGMYQVMPLGKEELDAETKAAAIAFKDRVKEVMLKFAEPASNEENLKKLGRIEADDAKTSSWVADATTPTPAAGSNSVNAEGEEDFDF